MKRIHSSALAPFGPQGTLLELLALALQPLRERREPSLHHAHRGSHFNFTTPLISMTSNVLVSCRTSVSVQHMHTPFLGHRKTGYMFGSIYFHIIITFLFVDQNAPSSLI